MNLGRVFSGIVLKAEGTSKGHPVSDVVNSAGAFGLAVLMFVFSIGSGCATRPLEETSGSDKKVSARESLEKCDLEADKAMRLEEYENSIRMHERFLQKEPANRLAFYHLGYIYGLTGNHEQETHYYEKAIAHGLKKKNIFLDMLKFYGSVSLTLFLIEYLFIPLYVRMFAVFPFFLFVFQFVGFLGIFMSIWSRYYGQVGSIEWLVGFIMKVKKYSECLL